jgi:hypothetical protein
MKKLAILLLAIFTTVGISYADDNTKSPPNARDSYYPSGFYLGLNLGIAQAQMDSVSNFQTKNSEVGGRTYFGYDFNRYFSLDIGYTLFPQIKYSNNPVLPDIKIKTNDYDAIVKGKYPLGEGFALYGQLGGAMLHSHLNQDGIASENASATVLAYGAGLDYVFANIGGLHMVLDWYHTDNKNGAPFNIPAENLYALGAYYQF